jgi:hypothetical protein
MVEVYIAVPTMDALSVEYTVEVDQPTFPDGSVLDRDITAIVGGHPGRPNDEILGIVFPNDDERMEHSTSAQDANVYQELMEAIRRAMASHAIRTDEY